MVIYKKKRNIVSLFLTLIIISLLILSGPVSAIKLLVQTDKATYTSSDEAVTFTLTINLETSEHVPLQNVTLDINASTGNVSATCTYSMGGTNLTACPNIEITAATVSTLYSNNSGYAYGYGYSSVTSTWDNVTTNFGYAYGYGYGSGNANSGTEFTYTITWNFSAADAGNGVYAAFIDAIAMNETGAYYIFRSAEAQFTINSAIANNLPTFKQNLAAQTATEDTEFNYLINATDDDGDELLFTTNATKFSASALQKFNSSSYRINFTPVNGQQGRQEINVTVTDEHGGKATQNFNLTINAFDDAPDLVIPGRTLTAIRSAQSTYQFSATDEEAGTLRYAINQTYDSTGLSISSTTGLLTFDGTAAAGNYVFEAMVKQLNNSAKNDTENIYLKVLTAGTTNSAPRFVEWNATKNSIVKLSNGTTMALTSYTNDTVVFTVTYTDADGDTTANVKWDKKAAGASTYAYAGTTGATYTVAPSALAAGIYNIKAVLSDGLSETTKTWTLSISPFMDSDGDGIGNDVDTCPLDVTNTCGTDKDSDGDDTDDDNLIGNSTMVQSNIQNLGLKVGGSTNLAQNFTTKKLVEFTTKVINQSNTSQQITIPIVSFNWAFSTTKKLNLTNVTITEDVLIDDNGNSVPYVIVTGLNLQSGNKKTVSVSYLQNPDLDSVCIYDGEAFGIVQLSENCTGTGEVNVKCSTLGVTYGDLSCTKNTQTGRMEVSGLTHSIVKLGTNGNSDTTTAATTGTGGGGGITIRSTSAYGAKASKGWSAIAKGGSLEMFVAKPEIPLQRLLVKVNKDLINVMITVAELIDEPKGMTNLTGKVYKYFDVSKNGLSNDDISTAEIEFQVAKSWLQQNSLKEDDIALYKYNPFSQKIGWEEQLTTKTSSDSANAYYRVQMNGLSYFAVAQKGLAAKPMGGITGQYTAFQIIDAIRAFYSGTSSLTAFEIIDIIRAFYGG